MPIVKHARFFLLFVLLCTAGCQMSDRSPADDAEGPWIKINEERISSSGNLFVKDEMGYQISNDQFRELLKLIASQNSLNFTVKPASLLERGAKVEVSGKDIGEVMTKLASLCVLKIEKTSETEWTVSDPTIADGPVGRVTMNDE